MARVAAETTEKIVVKEAVPPERSGTGMVIGVITFLVGIGLLLLTFKLAYDMFAVPPSQAVVITDKGALDAAKSGQALFVVLVRVLLLIVMGIVSSLLANRGVHLFTGSRTQRH